MDGTWKLNLTYVDSLLEIAKGRRVESPPIKRSLRHLFSLSLLHSFSVIASVWGVRSKSFFQYIYFNGSRTHAVTMVRTELTGAWTKKRGRELA